MNNSIFSLSVLFLALLGMGAYAPSAFKESEFELSWEEHFEKNELDSSKWTVITGDGCPDLCGWGNNELQYYMADDNHVRVEDGMLTIEAHKQSQGDCDFTSGKLVTKGKLEWKYGRIEIRAKLPTGKGTWMAFWMLPTLDRNVNWPEDGEIDIVEHVGYNPNTIYGAIHTEKYNGMYGTQKVDSIRLADVKNEFHTYAFEWTDNDMKWFVDDKLFNHIPRDNEDEKGWPFNQYDYHLILNLAVGGDWGGKYGVEESDWPQTMEIDHIKYYSLKD